MKANLVTCLLQLYPKDWREWFGDEFEELLSEEGLGPAKVFDIVRSAALERLFNPSGLGEIIVQTYSQSVASLVRKPSAYVPIGMSLIAATAVFGSIAQSGVQRGGDEGTAAHLFQLMLAGQLPILAFFAIKWLPRKLSAALSVMGIQALAAALALTPVFVLGL